MLNTQTSSQAVAVPVATQKEPGRAREARSGWWIYVVLTLGLIVMVIPFIWMVLSSLKNTAELALVPPTWIPQAPTLSNYYRLFNNFNFPLYFMNTVILAVSITVLNVLFCSMMGYALAKLKFSGRTVLFLLVLMTMMVPSAVTYVPLFVLMSKIHLVNTLPAVILPEAAAGGSVFLMRQFMLGIPDELLEAGRVDGASEFFLFWKVALPLSGPALATIGILTFLGSWNDFFWPLIVLTSDQKYNLPVALATFAVGQHGSDNGLLLAGAVIVILPILIVFLLLQRYITQGIAMTGLKG